MKLKIIGDGSLHIVVAFDVLEHIPQEKLLHFLCEVNRVLRVGGFFIARFPQMEIPRLDFQTKMGTLPTLLA